MDPNLGHNIDEIRRLLNDRNMISYVAYDKQGKIIAYLIGEMKHLNDGRIVYYISYLYVIPQYRNRKIGSQLIHLMIQKCKQRGTKFIMLTCDTSNKMLIAFYMKRGFIRDPILKNGKQHEVFCLYV